jgi:ammonia channel protein AmtB
MLCLMLGINLLRILVFFMQAGFTLVETGFSRSKNAGNIIMKNLMDLHWYCRLLGSRLLFHVRRFN